jgi:hypothetical protein
LDIAIDTSQQEGCFHSASRRLRKRKHSETDENEQRGQQKSIFTAIKEKFGFKSSPPKKSSVLFPLNGEHNSSHRSGGVSRGGANLSFTVDTNKKHDHAEDDDDEEDDDDGGFRSAVPRKRVKFDEENLIVSSISFQRQRDAMYMQTERRSERVTVQGDESLFSRFLNFTANLF